MSTTPNTSTTFKTTTPTSTTMSTSTVADTPSLAQQLQELPLPRSLQAHVDEFMVALRKTAMFTSVPDHTLADTSPERSNAPITLSYAQLESNAPITLSYAQLESNTPEMLRYPSGGHVQYHQLVRLAEMYSTPDDILKNLVTALPQYLQDHRRDISTDLDMLNVRHIVQDGLLMHFRDDIACTYTLTLPVSIHCKFSIVEAKLPEAITPLLSLSDFIFPGLTGPPTSITTSSTPKKSKRRSNVTVLKVFMNDTGDMIATPQHQAPPSGYGPAVIRLPPARPQPMPEPVPPREIQSSSALVLDTDTDVVAAISSMLASNIVVVDTSLVAVVKAVTCTSITHNSITLSVQTRYPADSSQLQRCKDNVLRILGQKWIDRSLTVHESVFESYRLRHDHMAKFMGWAYTCLGIQVTVSTVA